MERTSKDVRSNPIGTFARRVFAVFLLIVAASLCWLGGQLVLLGGSAYYILAGIMVLVSGVALWKGRRSAALIYWVFLAITWMWALWETDGDTWAMTPRVAGPTVIGLLFLIPFLAGRRMSVQQDDEGGVNRHGLRRASIAALLVVSTLVGVAALRTTPVFAQLTVATPTASVSPVSADDWPEWGNDKGGQRFSALKQITPQNVGRLKKVWEFHADYNPAGIRGQFEATPLKIRDSLFLCTPDNDIIAVDAVTGKERWRFRSKPDMTQITFLTCRGVAYYHDTKVAAGQSCADKIIATTIDARLVGLDFNTGQLCPEFGTKGIVDLKKGMGIPAPAYYYVTSAPAIIRDRIVFGGFVPDNQRVGGPSGAIRAFNAHDGSFAWAFDAGKPDMHGEPAEGQSYTKDTPNSWAPISADEQLGLVYLPTGNSTTDWYGGQRRPFDDRISSSVVALDAKTGALRWSFQTTHHDLWDYDVPSQPTLVDFPIGGQRVPALIQPTKRGQLFVLDRRTGKPLMPVEERQVPQTTVPGEKTSPTQPFSVGMPNFAGPNLTEKMMWGLTPIDQAWCRVEFKKSIYQGLMTPVSIEKPTLIYPGYNGGNDWGSIAVDSARDILIGPSLHVAIRTYLMPRKDADKLGVRPMSGVVHGDPGGLGAQAGTPYAVSIKVFLSPLGVPCQQPPWGLLNAIDLKTRKLIWSHPLGSAADSGPLGYRSHLPFTIGTPNAGGALVTKSGLTFIGASQDSVFHAFDTATGTLLWNDKLPAGGNANPMTYAVNGKQYVVIVAGGHALAGSKTGDSIVAYSLP